MAKLEKSLNDTVEDILKIDPKITMAKVVSMLGVNSRSITRTKAWGNRVKAGGRKKSDGNKKSDTSVDRNLKKGLQGQAKFIGVVVQNTLEEYHDKPLSGKEIKDVIDDKSIINQIRKKEMFNTTRQVLAKQNSTRNTLLRLPWP